MGCIFPVVVSILAVRSNERLGPAVAGAAGNVTPLFAVLFAVLFLGERLGWASWPVWRWWWAAWRCWRCAAAPAAGTGRSGCWACRWRRPLIRGAVQPAIKTALALWHEPLAAAAIGYSLSTVVILSLVGRRALARRAWPIAAGVRWFLAVGLFNGTATFLLYAALGLGSIALVAPLVALFPLIAVVLSYLFLRGEQLHAVGLLGIVVSVAGVILLLVGT